VPQPTTQPSWLTFVPTSKREKSNTLKTTANTVHNRFVSIRDPPGGRLGGYGIRFSRQAFPFFF
jgi:hypothetical protein